MKGFLKTAAPLAAALALCVSGAYAGSRTMPGTAGQRAGVTSAGIHTAHFQAGTGVRRACNEAPRMGFARCDVLYHTGVSPNLPSGWGAGDLESAYNLPSTSMGSGQTVAVVDAYDQPNIATDLSTYISTYGLTFNGTFAKYDQNGGHSYPAANSGWGLEESLDVEMMVAGCPNCNIILVEANSPTFGNLQTAEATAASLGATVISNSYSGSGANHSSYNISGVTILASAGDNRYGIADPADIPSVVSVGGTVLTKGGGGRGWSEVAWTDTGSGCAGSSDAKPAWQKAKWTPGCANRVANDVSAVAVLAAVRDTYGYSGWIEVDGTSISSPLVGSIFGLAGNSNSQDGGKTFWIKKHHKYLYDITSGSNGSCTPSYLCTAGTGYDGPTGWGTPNGVGAF